MQPSSHTWAWQQLGSIRSVTQQTPSSSKQGEVHMNESTDLKSAGWHALVSQAASLNTHTNWLSHDLFCVPQHSNEPGAATSEGSHLAPPAAG